MLSAKTGGNSGKSFFDSDNQHDPLARLPGTPEVRQERVSQVNWNIELNWATYASVQGKSSCTGSIKRRVGAHSISRIRESADQETRYPCCL